MKVSWRHPLTWTVVLALAVPVLWLGALFLVATYFAITGRIELAAVEEKLSARGEKLQMAELAPPPIPDEENFFADPFWTARADKDDHPRPFADITEDEAAELKRRFPALADRIEAGGRFAKVRLILPEPGEKPPTPDELALVIDLLEPAGPVLGEISRAAQRPKARYPIDYSRGIATQLPHVSDLLSIGQMLSLRARANLASGRPEAALADTLLIFRLARSVESEPLLISLLVRISLDGIAMAVVENALPAWDASQTRQLEEALPRGDQHLAMALRGERGFANAVVSTVRNQGGTGFADFVQMASFTDQPRQHSPWLKLALAAYGYAFLPGEMAFLYQLYQEWIDEVSAGGGIPKPGEISTADALKEAAGSQPFGRVRYLLPRLILPALEGAFPRVAHWQNRVVQARTACAIQQFALARRRLPTALDELVPDFLESVPTDPMDGNPLRYRADGGTYRLWSIGWNEVDENGEVEDRRKPKEGDWIWRGRTPAL
ncbi:MAG: hypothetical protein SFU53_13200 [Terrimicrobiaceae bacterium]|nr:hypothetical protein [Terrimicrobiaceae bacterium]